MASRFGHPVDPVAAENLAAMGKLWRDAPRRKLGPHDGLTDDRRGAPPPKGAAKRKRPDFVAHWREILDTQARHLSRTATRSTASTAPFTRRARLSRIGLGLDVLKPGRRSSLAPCRARRGRIRLCRLRPGRSLERWPHHADGPGRFHRLGRRHGHHPCHPQQFGRGCDAAGGRRGQPRPQPVLVSVPSRSATRRSARSIGPIIRCRSSAPMTACPTSCAPRRRRSRRRNPAKKKRKRRSRPRVPWPSEDQAFLQGCLRRRGRWRLCRAARWPPAEDARRARPMHCPAARWPKRSPTNGARRARRSIPTPCR